MNGIQPAHGAGFLEEVSCARVLACAHCSTMSPKAQRSKDGLGSKLQPGACLHVLAALHSCHTHASVSQPWDTLAPALSCKHKIFCVLLVVNLHCGQQQPVNSDTSCLAGLGSTETQLFSPADIKHASDAGPFIGNSQISACLQQQQRWICIFLKAPGLFLFLFRVQCRRQSGRCPALNLRT